MDESNNIVTKEKTFILNDRDITEERQIIEIENPTENESAIVRKFDVVYNSRFYINQDEENDNSSEKSKKKWNKFIRYRITILLLNRKVNKSIFQIKLDFFKNKTL